jgi:hypothetical protein
VAAAVLLNALLATPMNQSLPSGGEFGRLTALYVLAFAGLTQVEERFELFCQPECAKLFDPRPNSRNFQNKRK